MSEGRISASPLTGPGRSGVTSLLVAIVVGAVLASPLLGSRTAFAASGARVEVTAPGTVKLGATYRVSVAGTTGQGADNELIAFEGGDVDGLIRCNSAWGGEKNNYPNNELAQHYTVHGTFAYTFTFLAKTPGYKWFCAYLLNSKYSTSFLNNYATGAAYWTVTAPPSASAEATIPVGKWPDFAAVDQATGAVYVANSHSNTVSVINGATNKLSATVKVGSRPNGIGIDSTTGTVYVANSGSNTVSVINSNTNTVTGTIKVGLWPFDVGVDQATGTLFVPCFEPGTVAVIDVRTDAVVATVKVGLDPDRAAVDASTGMVYIANTGSSTVSVINGMTDKVVGTVPVGTDSYYVNLGGIAVDSANDTVYVAHEYPEGFYVLNGRTDAITANLSIGKLPEDVAVDPLSDRVFVANHNSGTISVIDAVTNSVSSTVDLGAASGPEGLAINTATGTLYVTDEPLGTVTALNARSL